MAIDEVRMWTFEHTVECPVSRDFAWQFWTDVGNWAAVDPSVESVKLDGPFATGTAGITVTPGSAPVQWRIADVQDLARAVLEIPAPGAVLRCVWRFEDLTGGGTRITQQASIEGEQAARYVEMFGKEMESGIPQVMKRLTEEMVKYEALFRK